MPRKSVSYLTSIRNEVTSTGQELAALATDLEEAAVNISLMTPEYIRTDKHQLHEDNFKAVKIALKSLNKMVKDHDASVKKLKDFF